MDEQQALYDVDYAVRMLKQRRAERDDPVTQYTDMLGGRFARHVAAHFPSGTKDAGTALIVIAACIGHMVHVPVPVVTNCVAFAGARLLEPTNAPTGRDGDHR